jgi:hypothetical protein
MKEPRGGVNAGNYFVMRTGAIFFVSRVGITDSGTVITYRVHKGENQGREFTTPHEAFTAAIERDALPAEL